jgi:hypothetical protein
MQRLAYRIRDLQPRPPITTIVISKRSNAMFFRYMISLKRSLFWNSRLETLCIFDGLDVMVVQPLT